MEMAIGDMWPRVARISHKLCAMSRTRCVRLGTSRVLRMSVPLVLISNTIDMCITNCLLYSLVVWLEMRTIRA